MVSFSKLEEEDLEFSVDRDESFCFWIVAFLRASGLCLLALSFLILLAFFFKLYWDWIGFIFGMLIIYAIMIIGIYGFLINFIEFKDNSRCPDFADCPLEDQLQRKRKWQREQKYRLRSMFLLPLTTLPFLGLIFLYVSAFRNFDFKTGIFFNIYFISNIVYVVVVLVMILLGITLRLHPLYGSSPDYLATYQV